MNIIFQIEGGLGKSIMATAMVKVIKKRYKLKALTFNRTKDVLIYADRMFDLFNDSFASLSSFVKITDFQKEDLKNKFLPPTCLALKNMLRLSTSKYFI